MAYYLLEEKNYETNTTCVIAYKQKKQKQMNISQSMNT